MVKKLNIDEVKHVAKKTAKKAARTSHKGLVDSKNTLKKSMKDSKRAKKKNTKASNAKRYSFFDLKDFLAPDGANPSSANHFEINDNGVNHYIRSFYISQLPKRGKFAEVFDKLFSFKNCNTTIYVEPVTVNEAIKNLDNDLTTIEAEMLTAEEKRDTNRIRKLRGKYNEAEYFQRMLEGRDNKQYNVAFVFSLIETNLEELDRRTSEFVYKAKDSGVELISFYANQEMAFKLNKPFNIKRVTSLASNLLVGVKWHPMDMYSLSTVFAHTSSEFYHEDGLVFGRNLLTGGHPVAWDLQDKSHRNQNVFFAGASGSGKSSTIKKLIRLYSAIKDQKFVILDVENIKERGEYADIVDAMGGYIFELKPNSKNIINPFEISDEVVYNVDSDSYMRTLKVAEKIPYTANLILSLISSENSDSHSNVMIRIVNDLVHKLYRQIGLREGEPDTLYKSETITEGSKVLNNLVKKELPTLSDFLIAAVKEKIDNEEELYHKEYVNLISGLSNYVNELNICEHGCASVYSNEEYDERDGVCSCGKKIYKVMGSFNFFDGQTTSGLELNFDNYQIISVDVSNVPKEYLSKAMMIGLNFIMENLIKKNSENVERAKRVAFINDEQHKTFPIKENRAMITTASRIIRKRNAGLWSATQSINDYTLYEDTKTIVTQSDTAFIFKHKNADKEALRLLLDDVNDSDLNFITSARIGEVFLSDAAGKARVKVDLLPIEMNFANTNLELEKELSS